MTLSGTSVPKEATEVAVGSGLICGRWGGPCSDVMHSESIQKRNQTVLKHLGLARHVSRQESRKGPESYEDLHQEAALGLIRGVDQFDPTLGFRPSSYLVRRIRGQVLHYRRDRAKTIRIPWRMRDLAVAAQRLQDQQKQAKEPCLSLEGLAAALNVSPHRMAQANAAVQASAVASLDHPDQIEPTAGPRWEDPQCSWLREALPKLERTQQTLLQRHFIDGIGVASLAKSMAMPPRTIKACLSDAVEQLRQMAKQAPDLVFS